MAEIGRKVSQMAKIVITIEISKGWRNAMYKQCCIFFCVHCTMEYVLGIDSRKIRFKT